MHAEEKKRGRKSLLEQLRDPRRLRVFVAFVTLAVGYGGIYMPLHSDIQQTSRKLKAEQKRLELARDVERLRAQYRKFQQRLPGKTDPNEWVQYVLGGIRQLPVKLVNLDLEASRDIGPYKAIAMRIELEGTFGNLNGFLRWLEGNERLFRIDLVKLEPSRRLAGGLLLQLTVLGMMG
jgi:hypothetical protein